MNLALLGYPIQHSLSPKLYQEFLGNSLKRYDLLEIESPANIPSLAELAQRYNGLNITSPHKKHFFHQVQIANDVVRKIGALNTLSFSSDGKVHGTNTDVLAVESLLKEYWQQYPDLYLIILGNGVMAKMTLMLAQQVAIPSSQLFRSSEFDLAKVDLNTQMKSGQMMVINACSRDFIFQGKIPSSAIFWDYNYAYIPHQNSLPSLVKSYIDGEEMLKRQALSAIEFWKETQP